MDDGHVHGLLVTHARLGDAFLDAASRIAGSVDGLSALSNETCSGDMLRERVDAWLDALPPGDLAILFVDLHGGSCSTAAMLASRPRANVHVATGVNLAMVLEFLASRATRPAAEVVARLEERGKRAILVRSAHAPAGDSS